MKDCKPILWNRNFVQCCISYFLMNFSFYMLMPTMPVYLVEVLGISTANVGIALSSYTIGLLCVRPFSGFLVDCFSRKPLYLFAFFVFAFMFGGYLIATTMLTIMAVRFVQGGFMGLTSVAGNTIAIDVIPSSRRGEGMGFYGLTINLAMSLAPLAAVAIYGKGGFNLVVFIGWMAAFIGVGSVCLIRYPKREKVPRPHFSLDRFILVKALPEAFHQLRNGLRLVSGRLVDHGKIHWVSVCSAVCLLVTFTVFATVHQSWVFFVCALMIGIGYGVGVPAFQCLFVNVAPHNMRGTATSTYLTSFDLGVGIGMLSAGFIASCAGLAVAYGVGAGCCLASLGVYLRWVRPSYEKHKLLV